MSVRREGRRPSGLGRGQDSSVLQSRWRQRTAQFAHMGVYGRGALISSLEDRDDAGQESDADFPLLPSLQSGSDPIGINARSGERWACALSTNGGSRLGRTGCPSADGVF